MGKRKSKGKKRKSKLSEAARLKARRTGSYIPAPPIHPDDLEGFSAMPSSFELSLERTISFRCLSCLHEWKGRPWSHEVCVRCHSDRINQQDAKYRCVNCGHEFWAYPGAMVGRNPDYGWIPVYCRNPDCRRVRGRWHRCDDDERGIYIEWVNFDEWEREHGTVTV